MKHPTYGGVLEPYSLYVYCHCEGSQKGQKNEVLPEQVAAFGQVPVAKATEQYHIPILRKS